jgi:hypothetical protein
VTFTQARVAGRYWQDSQSIRSLPLPCSQCKFLPGCSNVLEQHRRESQLMTQGWLRRMSHGILPGISREPNVGHAGDARAAVTPLRFHLGVKQVTLTAVTPYSFHLVSNLGGGLQSRATILVDGFSAFSGPPFGVTSMMLQNRHFGPSQLQ